MGRWGREAMPQRDSHMCMERSHYAVTGKTHVDLWMKGYKNRSRARPQDPM